MSEDLLRVVISGEILMTPQEIGDDPADAVASLVGDLDVQYVSVVDSQGNNVYEWD